MAVNERRTETTDLREPGRPLIGELDRLGSAISLAATAETLDELVMALSREARDLADATSAVAIAYGTALRPGAEAIDGRSIEWTGGPSERPRAFGDGPSRESRPPLVGSESAGVVHRLPLVDEGVVVGSLIVTHGGGRPDPSEERLALVRAFAAAAGVLIGHPRHRVATASNIGSVEGSLPSEAALNERKRIARELHDGLVQSLYGLGLLIRTQSERTDLPERGRQTMSGWVRRIDRLVEEAAAYVGQLESRGATLVDLGTGIDAIAEEAAAAGLDVSTEVSSTADARLSSDVRRELLIVAREAVSNAVRHGHARRLALHVEIDAVTDTVTLAVDDDGIGFEPASHRSGGHGLDNMATRAAALKGSLDILSRRSAGTRVRLRVPMRRSAADGSPEPDA